MTVMTDNSRREIIPQRAPIADMGATLLAAGGLTAAFGAASCCALPLLLGSLGIATAWLGGIALLAGPYRPTLLATALVSFVSGGLLLWRRHAIVACAPGVACGRPVITALLTGALSLGAVLTVLGFVFA
jgi:mercuric ion transport protein